MCGRACMCACGCERERERERERDPHKHPRSLSHPLYHCLGIALPMDPLHHSLSCSLVTWWQTVIRISLTHQHFTFPSRLLANLCSRRLPSRLPHSHHLNYRILPPPTPSLLSPPLPFPSIHLSSLPFLSFSSPFVLSPYVPSPSVLSPYDRSPYLLSTSSQAEVSSP